MNFEIMHLFLVVPSVELGCVPILVQNEVVIPGDYAARSHFRRCRVIYAQLDGTGNTHILIG